MFLVWEFVCGFCFWLVGFVFICLCFFFHSILLCAPGGPQTCINLVCILGVKITGGPYPDWLLHSFLIPQPSSVSKTSFWQAIPYLLFLRQLLIIFQPTYWFVILLLWYGNTFHIMVQGRAYFSVWLPLKACAELLQHGGLYILVISSVAISSSNALLGW